MLKQLQQYHYLCCIGSDRFGSGVVVPVGCHQWAFFLSLLKKTLKMKKKKIQHTGSGSELRPSESTKADFIPTTPPQPSEGNYTGTLWRHKQTKAYSLTVTKQIGLINGKVPSGLPTVPGDTMLTVKGNLGFPKSYCIDIETLSAEFDLVKRVIVNAPGNTVPVHTPTKEAKE